MNARWILSLLTSACLGVLVLFWLRDGDSAAQLTADAQQAVENRQLANAEELIAAALLVDPEFQPALLLGTEVAIRTGKRRLALDYAARLDPAESPDKVAATWLAIGQIMEDRGEASQAEEFYLRAYEQDPDNAVLNHRLAWLYLAECRRWESSPHLFALLKAGQFSFEEAAFIGNTEELYSNSRKLDQFLDRNPEDAVPMMGKARMLLFKNFTDRSEKMFRYLLERKPNLIEAQAQLGVILVSESREQEFQEWHNSLPPAADQHPEIWWIRATHARRHGQLKASIRCSWESVRRDPNHLGSTYQLAQTLAADGQTEAAARFAERAAQLESLAKNIHDVLMKGPDRTALQMQNCADTSLELGRHWEAWAWLTVLAKHHPDEADQEQIDALRSELSSDTPQTIVGHQLAVLFDYGSYPMPEIGGPANVPEQAIADSSQISFEESDSGCNFRYQNGAPADGPGYMIYQSIGGGVAVLDIDRDGRPDLFFPQAHADRPDQQIESPDQLYRNAPHGAFNVSQLALVADSGYGFSAAAGDVNGDGFPDLYVGNGGRNQLLLNNGDGTFQEASEAAGLTSSQWTATTMIADLNGDGFPELFDVNYCDTARAWTYKCIREDRKTPRTCIPTEFEAALDILLVSDGLGSFQDQSLAAGLDLPEGRGLGIVAAHLDDTPGLDLYIANDMTANYLLLNRNTPDGIRFQENGVIAGAAYDSDGRPQASMGIAAADVDGDGLLDLFLTHFFNESNTFYRQSTGGFFVDETSLVDLRNPSMQSLGFGTQFLDADLDGDPDLVVANGHVDDFTEKKIPFRMEPQFFVNDGETFVTLGESAGEYFTHKQIGRGLARLDWNRDGRDDFVVVRFHQDASIQINTSPDSGHYVTLHLVGEVDRDATGAIVTVTTDLGTHTHQLSAGDGFACSNEKQLTIGLGQATRIQRVDIRWRADQQTTVSGLSLDSEWAIVQGRNAPFLLTEQKL